MVCRRQGVYWLGTIPGDQQWVPQLPGGVVFLRGQLESGESGYLHHQISFVTEKKCSLAAVQKLFEPVIGHWELSRSAAADAYVWKEETRVGEQYQFGAKPFRRNSSADWEEVRSLAMDGSLHEVPADIFVRYYGQLTRIASDYQQPDFVERRAVVLWGPTGTGKSHRAWQLLGASAYSKDPRTKFWCGYGRQVDIIIDEFRGAIDVSHILRWTDRYPVRVEVKGATRLLCANRLLFTSNIHPCEWYPGLDHATYQALERRLKIVHVTDRDSEVSLFE